MDKRAKVLLVDDEPDALAVTAAVLRTHGYDVVVVQEAEKVLPAIRETQPDLVLLDRSMGRIDGLDICRAIKGDPLLQHILVVHLSAHVVTSDQQAIGLEAGADGYITRPISNRELLARVHSFLRLKRAEDSLRVSEAKFRNVIEQAGDGIVLVDEAGRIVEWNAAMERMLALPRAAAMSQPIWDLQLRFMHAERRTAEARERMLAFWQSFMADAAVAQRRDEVSVVRSDGQTRAIETSAFPIRADGRAYIGVIVRDITERKRAEAEREQLISDLQQAVAEVKTLSGLLPICASCKRIRNDQGYWEQLEKYIQEHSEARFTHGICPECARRLYPNYREENR